MSVVLHLLWACSGGGLDTGVTCADGELLDGAQCVPEACGTGTWGDLEADVWVDGDAEEGGDGSQEAPFRTLAEALAEDTRVGVAAGTYGEFLDLDDDLDDLEILGRCRELVVLDASELDDMPGVVADGRISTRWTLSSLTLVGGFPGMLVYDGRITLRDVDILRPRLLGILAYGGGAYLALEDVALRDVQEEDYGGQGTFGTGIDLQGGPELKATGLEISSAYGTGLLLLDEGTQVELTDVLVSGTRPDENGVGYGLQVTGGVQFTATGLVVEDSAGAGMLVSQDSVVVVEDLIIRGTTSHGQADSSGLALQLGGSVSVKTASFTDNADTSISVIDEGSVLELSDGVLSGGEGMQVQWGGQAILDGVHFQDFVGRGISVLAGFLEATDLTLSRTAEVALLAAYEGTVVSLEGVLIEDMSTLLDGETGIGLEVVQGAVMSAKDLVIRNSRGVAILASSEGQLDLEDFEIVETHPKTSGRFGRGLIIQEGAVVSIRDGVITDCREAGIFGSSGASIDIDSVVVERTGRSGAIAAGVGVMLQLSSEIRARDLEVRETQGPGLYVDQSVMTCSNCRLNENSFAGAGVRSGTLYLQGGEVLGNVPDAGLGGGVGVFASSPMGPPKVVLGGTTIADHAYGSVYLDGQGNYVLNQADLEGGDGWELVEGRPLHGDAVLATGGVGAWDLETGLLVVKSTLRDSAGAGVFLDGASALLIDNTWIDNAVDLVQQSCNDEVGEVVGAEDAPTSDICPSPSRLWVPLEFELHLSDGEASTF